MKFNDVEHGSAANHSSQLAREVSSECNCLPPREPSHYRRLSSSFASPDNLLIFPSSAAILLFEQLISITSFKVGTLGEREIASVRGAGEARGLAFTRIPRVPVLVRLGFRDRRD